MRKTNRKKPDTRLKTTQLKKAKVKAKKMTMRERYTLYQPLFDIFPDLIYCKDVHGRYFMFNMACIKYLGLKEKQIIGKTDRQIFPPDLVECFIKSDKEVIEHGKTLKFKEEVDYKGEKVFFETTKHPLFDDKGKRVGVIGVTRDTTNWNRVEKKSQLFENLINQSNDAIFVIDPETSRFINVNDKACSNLGYSRDELLKKGVFDIEGVIPDLSFWKEHVREVKKQGYMVLEGVHKRRDGTIFPVEVNVKFITLQGNDYMVAVARDITERKRVEAILLNERNYLEKLHDSLGDAVLTFTLSEKVIGFANSSVEPAFGYRPWECVGLSVDKFFPDREGFLDFWNKLEAFLKSRKGVLHTEHLLKRKNGKVFPAHITVTFLRKNDEVISVLGIIRDITELKKLEEEKIASQRRFAEDIAESLPGTFCIFDERGHIERWNKNFETATGYSPEEISRMHPLDFFEGDDKAYMADRMIEVFTKGAAEAGVAVLTKSGKRIPYFMMGRRISIDGKIYAIGMGFDITEQKKMELELFKAQKLESVGVLAGGIAHDFNNILTTILGSVSLAKMVPATDAKISKALTDAENGCLRAKELTRQLLTFSKGGVPVRKTISVVNLIKDTVCFTLSGSKSKPEFSMSSDIWPVEADVGQISQVINNLVLNADHAMPEGGIIEVRCENSVVSNGEIHSLKEGRYVKIIIKDHGAGIVKENLQKVFDPYFTTKTEGNGLGLATAYSIVKNHGGYIGVESEAGCGATFYLYLPASEERAEEHADKIEEPVVGGKGKLLFMDDDTALRTVASEMLTKLGYEVKCAGDGSTAVELYREAQERGEPFDAVIMDLTVPGGMGGKEAARKLLEMDPVAKVIVSSGYPNSQIIANYKEYGFCSCIAKPYRVNEIGRVVKDIIGIKRGPAA